MFTILYGSFMLLVMELIIIFSDSFMSIVLTIDYPYIIELSYSAYIRHYTPGTKPDSRAIASVHLRLHTYYNLTDKVGILPRILNYRNICNNTGDNIHICCTSTIFRNRCTIMLFNSNVMICKIIILYIGLCRIEYHSPYFHTLSKDFINR